MNPFLTGVSRLLNCPKVHVAATGLVTTWFAVHYAAADLPPTQRASLWVAFIGAVAVQLREIINSWSEEDVALVAASKCAEATGGDKPAGQQGDGATDRMATAPAPAASRASVSVRPAAFSPARPVSSPPTRFINAPQQIANSRKPQPQRSPDMPPRTTLPLILVASTLIVLFTTGCQTPTELTTYREGLHQLDEPLYQAHLLLLNDAVNANLRTDADRQVVQQAVAAAEALYQQSKATEAAGLPATQP